MLLMSGLLRGRFSTPSFICASVVSLTLLVVRCTETEIQHYFLPGSVLSPQRKCSPEGVKLCFYPSVEQ